MTPCTPLCTPSATDTPGAGPGTVASRPIRDAGETGRPLPLGRDHTGNRNTMPARLVRATLRGLCQSRKDGYRHVTLISHMFPQSRIVSALPGRCAGRSSLSPDFSRAEIGTAAVGRVPSGPARTEQGGASGAPSRIDGSRKGGWTPMR